MANLTISTPGELRAWLLDHHVHGFAVSDLRYISGTRRADGAAAGVAVTEAAMRGLDGEIVWLHDPEGSRLEPKTLFALRDQLAA